MHWARILEADPRRGFQSLLTVGRTTTGGRRGHCPTLRSPGVPRPVGCDEQAQTGQHRIIRRLSSPASAPSEVSWRRCGFRLPLQRTHRWRARHPSRYRTGAWQSHIDSAPPPRRRTGRRKYSGAAYPLTAFDSGRHNKFKRTVFTFGEQVVCFGAACKWHLMRDESFGV